MKWKKPGLKARLYLTAVIILVVGLGSAVPIYMTADRTSDSAMVQSFEKSKRYIHNLELYGGKMNVMADQFCRWFEGLWRGESLAFTIAIISSLTSFAYSCWLIPCPVVPIRIDFCLKYPAIISSQTALSH